MRRSRQAQALWLAHRQTQLFGDIGVEWLQMRRG
jgi:hypothetical protein